MLTSEIRSQIDQIWNAFWSGGISNPLEVIEQITYLLFLKRLDEQEIAEELKANRGKKLLELANLETEIKQAMKGTGGNAALTCRDTVKLEEIATVSGASARSETDLPVYSVTKHRGFVRSLEYFNKQGKR